MLKKMKKLLRSITSQQMKQIKIAIKQPFHLVKLIFILKPGKLAAINLQK